MFRSLRHKRWSVVAGLLVGLGCVHAQPMRLDPDFAIEVESAYPAAHLARYAVTADQQLLVLRAGRAYVNDALIPHGIARLLPNGSLDAAFTAQLAERETAHAAVALPDGRLWVATSSGAYLAPEMGRIVRLHANGALDASFSPIVGLTGGATFSPLSDGSMIVWGDWITFDAHHGLVRIHENGTVDSAFAAGLVPVGRAVTSLVVISGDRAVLTTTNTMGEHRLVRLTRSGAIDTSFTSISASDALRVLAGLADDRLLIWDGEFRRLNPDGTVDPTFAPQIPMLHAVQRVIVLPGNRLAVEAATGASADQAITSVFVLAANGALEQDGRTVAGGERIQNLAAVFSDGRVVLTQGPLIWQTFTGREPVPGMADPKVAILESLAGEIMELPTTIQSVSPGAATVDRLASDSIGRILVAGDFTHLNGAPRAGYARFNRDGTLDSTFRPIAVTPLFHLPDGALIASRTTVEAAAADGFHPQETRIVKIDANGALDPAFLPASDFDLLHARWLGVAADGRMLALAFVGGTVAESHAKLVWLNRDGSLSQILSTTFGGFLTSPGLVSSPAAALSSIASAAALLPDGRILLATGDVATVNGGVADVLVRLNPDGTTDGSYRAQTRAVASVYGATPLPDGRAYVYWTNFPGSAAATVLRLNADGSPDTFVPRELAGAIPLYDETLLNAYAWQRFHADGTRDLNFQLDDRLGFAATAAQAADGGIWTVRNLAPYRQQARTELLRLVPVEVAGFTFHPWSQQVVSGFDAMFQAELGTAAAATFQWTYNGVAIAGATDRVLRVLHAGAENAGEYRVSATVDGITYMSEAASLTIAPSVARVVNFSARAAVAPGYPPQIGGFVLRNESPRSVLLRGVGGGLPIDDPGFILLPDPVLTLYRDQSIVARDAGGALAPAITEVGRRLGAAALRPTFSGEQPTRDSAVLHELSAGVYTAHIASVEGRSGISLFEFYDGDPANSTSAVLNVSVRGRAAPGHDALIAGFVINGTGPMRLLIRGIGPGLTTLGVPGAVTDPEITLFAEAREIGGNDNWASNPDLTALTDAAARAGAFALPSDSRDAAIMVALDPGVYTVHGRAVDGTAGEMMIELYVLED